MTVSEGRPSALKVTLVVGFYMISALVVSVLSSSEVDLVLILR